MGIAIIASSLVKVVWGLSVAWIGLASACVLLLLGGWATHPADPQRYEGAIAAGIILIYTTPAILGAIASSVIPGTGLSPKKRVIAVLLALFLVGLVLVFDHLQAAYR